MKLGATAIVILGMFGLFGCQSVHDDLEKEIVRDGKPRPRVQDEKSEAGIQVPDLDKRKEDTQFLSKIDRLQHEVFDLRNSLKVATAERDEAIKVRNAAQRNESELAELIEEYQGSLASSADQIKKLRENLLRTQLESVRYQQLLADMKIRQLTKGEGQ